MTTTAKDFAAKAFVAVVATAMVFSLVAPAAKAATAEELQAQITALMAQITALQGGTTTTTTTTTSTAAYTFTRSLTIGSEGADVTALQTYLISKGFAIPAGATGYFGSQTASAVAAWQTANMISPAAGYFGPVSQAKYMALMAATPTTPTTPGTTPTTPGTSTTDLSGEADLDKFEVNDADDTDVSEGDADVEIGEFTVEFKDGDAEIDRLTISTLLASDNGDVRNSTSSPWDLFDTVSLWVDGKMIAEVDASDENDDYLDEDDRTIRFSEIGLVAMEDEEVVITVGASLQDNLDDTELADWEVFATEMRYFDADGVASDEDTVGDLNSNLSGMSNPASFTVEVAGQNEELKFSLGSNNPDSTDIIVDETSSTKGVTILEYTIEAEDGDIDLTTLAVMLTVGGDYINDVVSDIEIDVDGQAFSDDSFLGSKSNATTTFLFDIDGDVTINEGDEVTVKVMVDFKRQQGGYNNGTTIKAQAVVNSTEAEGADDLGTSQFSGSAVGDTHNLVATGILVPVDGVTVSTDTKGDNDQTGEFKIEFEVTAVEGDFYITDNVFTSTSSATDGIAYLVELGSGSATTSGVLSSTADEETDGVYTVRDGETETFTLTVTVDTSATTQARVTLSEVNYSATNTGLSGTAYVPTPASDFRTDYTNINAN